MLKKLQRPYPKATWASTNSPGARSRGRAARIRAEIADLGFPDAQVHPLGGAYAGFDSDDSVVIWGTSDEYGCCDKDLAARLIARAYPGRTFRIEA